MFSVHRPPERENRENLSNVFGSTPVEVGKANVFRRTVDGAEGFDRPDRCPQVRPSLLCVFAPNPSQIRPRPHRAPPFPRRLIGGVELMQAIGLRLEENGTVLALREVEQDPEKAPRAGGKWERVPDGVLRRLDTAAKVKMAGSAAVFSSGSKRAKATVATSSMY